jgi:Na+/melibiose symporter-like transporter
MPKGGNVMAKTKTSQEGWRTTKKERRNYIIGDLGRTLEGYIVTAMMSTFMIFQGIDMTAVAGAMLVVKMIDAFDDVIFGYFVDRIHITEWKALKKITGDGKYLPWYDLFPVSHFYGLVLLYAQRLVCRSQDRMVLCVLSAV